jgi:DNA-binding transcriptional MerR regulator
MSQSAGNRHLVVLQPESPSARGVVSEETAGRAKAAATSSESSGSAAPALSAGELLQVGDLARATGKTVRAIHLYEDLGLLRPQDRSKGRYRLFSPDSVLRVRWISKLQSLGLSLSDIQELVREHEDSGSAMFAAAKLRDVYARKLEETRSKIRELALLEHELGASLDYLSRCDTSCMPDLPTHSCSGCERHVTHAEAPELVAGVRAH